MATRCTATTTRGQPCKCWAVRDTDPPRCVAHGGAVRRPGGAPRGNTNAVTHGAYARPGQPPKGIDGQIEDLDRRIVRLGAYIDERQAEFDPGDLIKLLNLHSTMIARVTRVREVRQRMEGDDDTALAQAINQALDAISEEWGIQL